MTDKRRIAILVVAGVSLIYGIAGIFSILTGSTEIFILVFTPLHMVVALGFWRMQPQALPIARVVWSVQFIYELLISLVSRGTPYISLLPLATMIFLFVIKSDWFPDTPQEVQPSQKRFP